MRFCSRSAEGSRYLVCGLALLVLALPASTPIVSAQTDLDAFMQQVLARRDDNWKKLQQYILDEHEQIELRGPSHQPLWGERREYTWYIRDGYFVRSPLKFNGVAIGDADRRKYEADFLRREKEREKRRQANGAAGTSGQVAIGGQGIVIEPGDDPDKPAADLKAAGLDALISQTRQPQFISSAYFLRFKFEEGKYALVGHEQLDGHDVLHIEYYPTKLYSNDQRRRQATTHDKTDPYDTEMQRLLNKVALVSIWVEPSSHQIVKYTFDNIGFDFLPAQWLVRVNDLKASMTMGQPFPGVWLPRAVELTAAMTLAIGPFDVRYALDYHDYKLADVKTKVRIGGAR